MEFYANDNQGIIYRNTDSFFGYCGWPSVCHDDDGVLYAVCSGFRAAHICPFGKTLLFKSFDDGKTWSIPMVINDTWLDDRDVGILCLGGNTLMVSWFTHPTQVYLNKYSGSIRNSWGGSGGVLDQYPTIPEEHSQGGSFVRVSYDGGMTWGETVQVPVSAPHGPVLRRDGSLLYLGKEMYAKDGLEIDCVAAYESRDMGKTWQRLCVLDKDDDIPWVCYDEPHAIELDDGRILGSIRWEGPSDAPHPVLHQTFSADGGRTWSAILPTDLAGTRYTPPHLFRHSSGALIQTFGRREIPYGERAAVSYNNGESWQDEYILNDTGCTVDLGYAATTELSDGSLLTVYYQAYEGDTHPSLLCTRWNLQK